MKPNLRRFRTNESSTRIALAALWERGPRDIETGRTITATEIAEAIDDRATAEVSATIVPSSLISADRCQWASNRIITVGPTDRIFEGLFSPQSSLFEVHESDAVLIRQSHIVSDSAALLAQQGEYDRFLEVRDHDLERAVTSFIERRTGSGFEHTPPLVEFDLDDVRDDVRDDVEQVQA